MILIRTFTHFLLYLNNRINRLFNIRRWSGASVTPNDGVSYVIWNPSWPDPPTTFWSSRKQAEYTAKALLRNQPRDVFYVLKVVSKVSRTKIKDVEVTVEEFPAN